MPRNRILDIIEGYSKLTLTELGLLETNPVAAERLAKCVTCPAFKSGICSNCICYMPSKVLVSHAFCPIGLW